MSDATIGAMITAVAAIIVAVIANGAKMRADLRSEIREMRDDIAEVRELARPTGNGFAQEMRAGMTRVCTTVARIEQRQVDESKRTDRIEQRIDDHLS